MKIAVIGSGAMGCRFGMTLHKAGAEVYLYDVWQQHVDSICSKGLLVRDGEKTETVKLWATTNVESIPAPDVVILFTKSIHTDSALQKTLKIMNEKTAVLTLQNGLGNIELIEKYIPRDNIIAGITNYATDLTAPGEIRLKGSGITKIAPLGEKARAAALAIHDLLNRGGINTVISDDVMVDIWEKVAFNAAYNTLTFLTFLTVGGVGNSPEGYELAMAISSEVIMVAKIIGVGASVERVHDTIRSVIEPHKEHKPSMLQDRLMKRRTEADFICGWVLEIARKNGIGGVEHLDTVYKLIKMIESNY